MMTETNTPTKKCVIKKRRINQSIYPYLYILPAFLFLCTFLLAPLMTAFIKSFYRYNSLNINQFIGFDNYIMLLTSDGKFWRSMVNLGVFYLGMNICFVFPIITAKLTHSLKSEQLQYFFRSSFILPIVVPGVVTLLLWKFIYYPEVGVLSKVISNFGMKTPNFLGDANLVKSSIIFIGFPWVSGLAYIILYSTLQSIDRSLIEAASMDGASKLRIFFKIELPLMKSQIATLYILAVIGLVQDYERLLILTSGGPNNASLVPGLHMYQNAFNMGEARYGYACAIAVVLFFLTMIISFVSLNISRRNK